MVSGQGEDSSAAAAVGGCISPLLYFPKSPIVTPGLSPSYGKGGIERSLFKLRYQCDAQFPVINNAHRTGQDSFAVKYNRIDHIRDVVTEYAQHYQKGAENKSYMKMGREIPFDNVYRVRSSSDGRIVCGLCEPRKGVLGVYVYDEDDDNSVVDAFEISTKTIHQYPLIKNQRFYRPVVVRSNDAKKFPYVVYLAEPILDEDEQTKWLTAHNAAPLESELNLGERSEALKKPQAFLLDIEERRIIPLGQAPTAVVQATVLNDHNVLSSTAGSSRSSGCSQSSEGEHTRSEDDRVIEEDLHQVTAPSYFDVIISHLHPRWANLGIAYHPTRPLLHTLIRVELATGTVLGSTAILENYICVRDFLPISHKIGANFNRYAALCVSYPDVGEHNTACEPQLLLFNVSETPASAPAATDVEDITPDNRTCDTKDATINLDISQLQILPWLNTVTKQPMENSLFLPAEFEMTAELIERSTRSGWILTLDSGAEKMIFFRFNVDGQEYVQWSCDNDIPFPYTRRLWLNKGAAAIILGHQESYALNSPNNDNKGSPFAAVLHKWPVSASDRWSEVGGGGVVSRYSRYEAFFLPNCQPSNSVICYRRLHLSRGAVRSAMIFSHGGPNSMAFISRGNDGLINFFFASTPIDLIVVPNYPGSVGYGTKYVNELAGKCGDLEIAWCLRALKKSLDYEFNAVQHDDHNQECDKVNNIDWPYSHIPCIAYGGSHGGFISAHLACQTSNIFRGAVLLNPVTDASMHTTDIPDWATYQMAGVKYTSEQLTPDHAALRLAQYQRSPISKVERISCPILCLLGQKDKRVDWHQGRNFYLRVREIEKAGKGDKVISQCMLYKDSNHSLSEPSITFHKDVQTAAFIASVVM